MASPKDFVYPCLTDPASQIRLLQILPSNDDVTSISITLEPFQRSPDRIYDALSYTWGDASTTIPVVVNGCRFHVTQNLHHALTQLRDFKDTQEYARNRYIWIDALCINQNDNDEKSVQVQMMKDIFADAAQVIIWLGIPSSDYFRGLEAIDMLAKLSVGYLEAMDQGQLNLESEFDELVSNMKDVIITLAGAEPPIRRSIAEIFGMPWWERVWIIQEVAVARRAWVIFGDGRLNFESLRHLKRIAQEMAKADCLLTTTDWFFHSIRISSTRLEGVLRQWLQRESGLLEALLTLYLYGNSQSTGPHDRLYALLGLGIDDGGLVGRVDYSQPWEKVYTKLARVLLRIYGLRILTLCASSAERTQSELPSWVPDWTKHIPRPSYSWDSPHAYNASGESRQTIDQQYQSQELALLGNRVAGICELESPYSLEPTKHDDISLEARYFAVQDWHKSVVRLASTLELSAEQKEQIIMRTAAADTYWSDELRGLRRLEASDEPRYKEFLEYIDLLLRGHSEDISRDEHVDSGSTDYLLAVMIAAEIRRPFKTDGGHLGVGPRFSEIGDIICIFHGATVPFVLRPASDGRWKLLGEAYVDGIMDGQFMETAGPGETFVLI